MPKRTEFLPYKVKPVTIWSHIGRTKIEITCPFCETRFNGFLWSLCGSGKLCPGCGALNGGYGARRVAQQMEDTHAQT